MRGRGGAPPECEGRVSEIHNKPFRIVGPAHPALMHAKAGHQQRQVSVQRREKACHVGNGAFLAQPFMWSKRAPIEKIFEHDETESLDMFNILHR